ncbi:MAG: type I-E CRISPR-associated protein Cas5/CasD [Ruminiclostridium sp.]|nr:type I-E CRISPR-associated protein Cas5/CasD [Ruminiclostridium sp.]
MTLLIRLAAPLQAWGSDSKFNTRRTEREPTKSGVIGLCACALGRKRTDTITDLAELRYGVRTDKQGQLITDFQTAKNSKTSFLSYRHYLADAVFIAGLEGDTELLMKINAALGSPVYPLFLGRRSCPPTLPLSLGLVELPLLDALKEGAKPNTRILIDCEQPTSIQKRDLPLSFSQENRKYIFRSLKECWSYVHITDKS